MASFRSILLVAAVLAACKAPTPSSPEAASAPAPPNVAFTGAETTMLYSFVDESGAVRSVDRLADIPEDRRRNVMVVDLSRSPEDRQADKFVYFADVTAPGP